jgi:hypothetical protein
LLLFLQRALKKGKQVHLREAQLRDEQMGEISRSSADWRCFYRKKIRRQFVLREFLFVGFAWELPFDLLATNNLCAAIAGRFGAAELFRRFSNFLVTKTAVLEEHGALAVFYYCQIAQMLEDACDGPESLSDIPRLIFDGEAPLQAFDGYAVANVDLVLKYFIRNLRKAWEDFPQQFLSEGGDCRPGEFTYLTKIDGNSGMIRAAFNGVKILSKQLS